MTKIIFMGTPAFAVPILQGLIDAQYEILGVVTQPDRPQGRKKVLTPSPVKRFALTQGLKVWQPEKLSQAPELEEIMAAGADLMITAAFGQFLPERLLQATPYGVLNVHASLLPKYRGGAPIHYAVMSGDEETGVTIMKTVKKMDAGPMLAQAALPIGQQTVGELFERLSLLGRDLLLETLPSYLAGTCPLVEQDESCVSFAPNIQKEQERIDWTKTAFMVARQIQGMNPFPGAYTLKEGKRWKLWSAQVDAETTSAPAGTLLACSKEGLKVACGEGTVLTLTNIQPAGKSALDASAFYNGIGRNMKMGDHFDE